MIYLRRLPKFEYLATGGVDEVCDRLAAYGNEVRLLAGGTDLLLQMRRREIRPAYILGLKGVTELSGLHLLADGGLAIGAMTTIHAVTSSPLVRERYGVLAEAAAGIGGRELRNVATIGGNLAGALPCADLPPALITLGAKVRLKSRNGERELPVEELFSEFGRTVVRPDEILTTILVPSVPAASAGSYLKFHDRQSMDMTTVGVSAFVTWDEANRVFRDVKIALASSAPVPMRAKNAETVLRGRAFAEDALEEAALAVCEEAEPRTSWRATREFRFELLRSLTKRAIRGARDKAAPTVGGLS
jgi:CO/xanthine dehydrogenase FAD-binding subunit